MDKLSRQEEKRKKDYCDHKAAWEETNRAFSQTERQFFGNLAGILAEQLRRGSALPGLRVGGSPEQGSEDGDGLYQREVWRQRREETDRCRDELYQKKQEFEKKQQERKSKEESLQERLEKLRREIEREGGVRSPRKSGRRT